MYIMQNEYNKMQNHALKEYPNECCGVLIGDYKNDNLIIEEARALKNINTESRKTRYNIDPHDLIMLDDELDKNKKEFVGIYHSHPNHKAIPSEIDKKYAWDGLFYIIIEVNNHKIGEIGCWNYKNETFVNSELKLWNLS